jgi:hypothetical protein
MALDPTHGPITERNREIMQGIARGLELLLNGQGFVLLVFDMETDGGRSNYISNQRREDMVVAMKELIARFEGRVQPTPERAQ